MIYNFKNNIIRNNDIPAYLEEIDKVAPKFSEIFTKKYPKFKCKKIDKTNFNILCLFCHTHCKPILGGQQFIEKDYFNIDRYPEILNPKCDCHHEEMSAHDDLNLLMKFICDIFNNADDSKTFRINDVMDQFEFYLKEFYGDLNENETGRKLVNFTMDSIKILSYFALFSTKRIIALF